MEIEKKSIVFIAYDCQNKAVWNAFKIHIEFISSLGYTISFIVNEKNKNIVQKDYSTVKIYTYTNLLNLMFKLKNIPEERIYSPATFSTLATCLAKIFKSKEVFYWIQGVIPEESFLRHKSKLRYALLSSIEYASLALSSKQIFVSNEMQHYLEGKYKQRYKKSIVVPCISEFQDDGSTKEKDSFVYIGGMSAWQRIDKMLKIFSDILTIRPHAKLYIATLEKNQAFDYIALHIEEKYRQNIEVLTLNNREEIPHFLSTKEYGFLIREENIVNYVSSPIKLAEYLSCGVNVIVSASVKSYAVPIEKNFAGISLMAEEKVIERFNNFLPNRDNALKVYEYFFSKREHLLRYEELLK